MKNLKAFLVIAITILTCLSITAPVLAATEGKPCSPYGTVSGKFICTNCVKGNKDCIWVAPPGGINPDCNNPSPGGLQSCLQHNKIIQDFNDIIDFLSAGVGIVVVGSIILGGIQYTMAGGSPDAVGKAKQRITNALIALVVFLFIFAFLQWLIPGGL